MNDIGTSHCCLAPNIFLCITPFLDCCCMSCCCWFSVDCSLVGQPHLATSSPAYDWGPCHHRCHWSGNSCNLWRVRLPTSVIIEACLHAVILCFPTSRMSFLSRIMEEVVVFCHHVVPVS
ncbi:unnamed protein product [Linum tenue]|uniref:Secreted protein n=1 Tax=Linum tenue TaxID=586396 RepID=A0AAV0PV60_9ROSI|nr:unnamed protein product [Linum tenue]